MIENKIDTILIKKNSPFIEVCNNCNKKIMKDEVFFFEVGKYNHLHSLISRRFCFKCYSKFGEKKLLGYD